MSEPRDAQAAGEAESVAEQRAIEHLVAVRRFDAARDRAAALAARDPGNTIALCLLGWIALQAGDMDSAGKHARAALSAGARGDWPLRLLAASEYRSGRHVEALEFARAAVTTAPQEWLAHYVLAQVAKELESTKLEAHAAAQRAVQLAPDVPEAHVMVAMTATGLNRRRLARTAVDEALRLAPGNASAMNELGRYRMQQLDPIGAASRFVDATRAAPHLGSLQRNARAAVARAVLIGVILAGVAWFACGESLADGGSAPPGGWVVALCCLTLALGWTTWQSVRLASRRLRPYLASLPRSDPYLFSAAAGVYLVLGQLTVASVSPADGRWPWWVTGGCTWALSASAFALGRLTSARREYSARSAGDGP